VGGYGESPLFYAQGGNPVPPGVSLPRPLIGLESFSVLQEVPEPSAWLLFAVGIGGLAWRVSRRRGVLSPQRQRPKLSSFRQCGGTITQCAIVVARSDPDAGLARPGGSVRRLSATRATAVSWGFQTIATLGVIALFAWLSQLGSAGAAPNVIAWGDNCYDQTDVPPGLMNPVAVAAGNYHSLALKCDGTVAAWGAYMTVTSYVPATVPTDLANVVAIAAGLEHSVALRADGTVIAWGANSYGQANVPLAVRNAAALAGGYYFSVALLGDGPPIVMECRPIHRFAT
jgi:hypothetical protein